MPQKWVLLVVICAFALALGAAAEPSANVKAALGESPGPSGPYEHTPIRRSASAAPGATTQTAQPGGATGPGGQWDFSKVPLALAGVIVLILLMRWLGRRFIPGAKNGRSSRAVQVLVRSTVGPKQQLMLVQVGRRLVLVGSGGAEMNPLCQIDDPDEVAELLGQIRGEQGAGRKDFGAMFGRAGKTYDEALAEEDVPPEAEGEQGETGEELAGLMERVKRISSQFQGSR